MPNAIDAALSFIVASYQQTSAESAPQAAKVRKERTVKACALPNDAASVKQAVQAKDHNPAGPVMPSHPAPAALVFFPIGSLDHRGFLRAINAAPSRDLRIQAIAAYCGYNKSQSFGEQEFNARQNAMRALRPVDPSLAASPLLRAERTAVRSVQGYVAGLPNGAAKALLDLKAREALAVETMADHDRQANEATDESDRQLHQGMAQVEAERLIHIRQDMARFQ